MRSHPEKLLALLLSLAALGPACRRPGDATASAESKGGDASGKPPEEAVPVEAAQLERGRIEAVLRFSTNLVAENQVSVHAQAARLVRELRVEEGDSVVRDQLLLRLQDEEQRSALAKAQSQHDRVSQQYQRHKELFERQLITEQTFSDSRFEFEQRRLALDDARREVGYTDVRAPIAGVISKRLVNVGDLVTVGQHLFDIVDFDSLVAPVHVPEKELPLLAPGQLARIRGQGASGLEAEGRIQRSAPIVDPKSGSVKVVVELTSHAGLRPGMYVDVALVSAVHEAAVLVPKRALVYDKDQIFVYRLRPGRRVERVLIEPLLADREFIEPVAGLEAGEEIVLAGQAGLSDGALVRLPGDPEPPRSGSAGAGSPQPGA